SLSYVPMVTSLMLHKKVQVRESITDRFMEKVKRVYGSLLERSFRFPKSIMLGSVVLFFIAALVASRLGGEFIPKLEEGDFAVDARILTGSSLTATVHNSLEAAKILKKFPEVENIVTRIGSSEIPTDPMPVEMTDI
ncbi:MAG: efflux RND transporter permease subunit, partial [Sphingobacteriales bacterium]